jgi:pimeloyl-ACP methyl ester carboxylesterase
MAAKERQQVEFERTTVTVAGQRPVRLSVIDHGPTAGASRGTLVMVHGAGGDAMQWKHQIAYFGAHYRVIAADLRGHGLSEAPRSAYSLEEFLWDFTQILAHLHVDEPFTLMAHSFGGPIALTFSAAQPERVNRLVLVATAPEMHLSRSIELLLRLPLPLSALERARKTLFPKVRAPLFVIQRVLAGTLFPWRGWDLLSSVTVPALILGGQFDFIVLAPTLQRMRSLMANAQFEVIRYTGHLPQLERPDSLNRHVEAFLQARRRSWRGADEEEGSQL